MAATDHTAGASPGNPLLPLLQTLALDHRATRLEADAARIRDHLDDGDPAVRKHAREWLGRLDVERQVLGRWRSEIAVGALL